MNIQNTITNKQEVWIGVDLGTTGVRAIAYDVEGQKYCSSEAFYPLLTPHPDWAEENPLQIFESVEKVIKETAAELRYKNFLLQGIALSTVMHSFAGLDEHYEPLMDMQTWADSRSASIVKEMKQDEKLCRSFYEKTGCPIHACYPLAKVIWLRRNHPEIFQQMRYVGSLKDYIFRGLTGEWLIDHSAASTSGMYNEKNMDWDDEILAYAGLRREQMPKIVSTTYMSKLSSEAAAAMELLEGVPVVIGATDGVLVNVGIGAVHPGQFSATIGTSGALRMLTSQPMTDPKMRTWCYNLVDDMWVAGGAINNSEGAAFGAVVLGFIASGRLKSIKDTTELVHPRKVYTPIPENAATYKELYVIFELLYWNLQQEFVDIAVFQKKM